jgi:hypothetical protein
LKLITETREQEKRSRSTVTFTLYAINLIKMMEPKRRWGFLSEGGRCFMPRGPIFASPAGFNPF